LSDGKISEQRTTAGLPCDFYLRESLDSGVQLRLGRSGLGTLVKLRKGDSKMNAPRYLRLGWLALYLSISISTYANSPANVQQTAAGGEGDGLVFNGLAHTSSISSPINFSSPLSAGQQGLPRNEYGSKGLSSGRDFKPINPPLPPVEKPIPEPGVLMDLGFGLAAFAILWHFRMRRSA
jgi:hypothetical protein